MNIFTLNNKSCCELRKREIRRNNSVLILGFIWDKKIFIMFRVIIALLVPILLFTWANNKYYVCQRLIYRSYFRISATISHGKCLSTQISTSSPKRIVLVQFVAHRLSFASLIAQIVSYLTYSIVCPPEMFVSLYVILFSGNILS